jgi:hypothetical protein
MAYYVVAAPRREESWPVGAAAAILLEFLLEFLGLLAILGLWEGLVASVLD